MAILPAVLLPGALARTAAATPAFRSRPFRMELPPVAILGDGVAWADRTRVLFRSFSGRTTVLGGYEAPEPFIAASSRAVIAVGRGARDGESGASPPGRLAPIGQIEEPVQSSGCSGWFPAAPGEDEEGEIAIAGETVIANATCSDSRGEPPPGPQPLFARNVHGGEWRVLRWLRGGGAPVLATEGNLLAAGVPLSATRMEVIILDVANGRRVARFGAPLGYLSFASPTRLVVSVLVSAQFASAAPVPPTPSPQSGVVKLKETYRVELFSRKGRPLADLGTFGQHPLVSRMHLLTTEAVGSADVLSVRAIPRGAAQPVVAPRPPARSLQAVAFRWPAVAAVMTTAAPREQSEVACGTGEYHRPSPPFLAIFDLARSEPFVPAPAAPHLERPRECPEVAFQALAAR